MICLKDAIQPDFDRAEFDKTTDANLYSLLKKTDSSILGWQQQEQPLEAHELLWLKALKELADVIRNTLNRRYGCND